MAINNPFGINEILENILAPSKPKIKKINFANYSHAIKNCVKQSGCCSNKYGPALNP